MIEIMITPIEFVNQQTDQRNMNTRSKSERDLSMMGALLGASAFGAVLAASDALRVQQADVRFKLSIWTAIAFFVGFDCLFAYLRLVSIYKSTTPRVFHYTIGVVLMIVASTALLYPWWSGHIRRLTQDFTRAAVVLCFVGAGLILVYLLVPAAKRQEETPGTEEMWSTASVSRSGRQAERKELDYENWGN
jgi:hypothetical protein